MGTTAEPGIGTRRRRRRATIAKAVIVFVLVAQAFLLVRGGFDEHKLFGFRPFNESDTWSAEIVRVTATGERIPIDDGTWAYDWDDLVGTPKLAHPGVQHHAAAGAPAIVDFLDRGLDWVVDNIPDDHETVALEATVITYHNTRGPDRVVLRAERRSVP